ncbi:Putative E3 ubiquitin-protein ligase UBR7 [Galdieria sulphuraria]|nr:Putative E3 ubiquitin-protein ligase UBR7 [Galdieria sulphuraria]
MVDVVRQQEEENWHDSSCTFPLNCASQDVFGCKQCTRDGQTAGFCRGCRAICHGEHFEKTFEIDGKRDFICDCGNSKMHNTCKLFPDKPATNETNKYNHNFWNRFCYCEKEYSEDAEDMIQCFVCEDWYHVSCLNLKAPWCAGNIFEEEFDLVCSLCIQKYPFLQHILNVYPTKPNGQELKFCVTQSLPSEPEQLANGDYGLFRGWQNYLCRCEECSYTVSEQGLLFLFEDDAEGEGEDPDNHVSRLLHDPIVERMFVERYALARELLYEELRPFAESKSIVTEQDMNAILNRLKERIFSETTAS